MIKSIKALFGKPSAIDEVEIEHQLQLAAAALLIEMSRADYEVQPEERRTLETVLGAALDLSQEEVDELVTLASTAADRATSLYEFTRLINDHYDKRQKLTLIESMWKVAYADCDLDKYEERLIRQVSDLIHVSHSDFIRSKLRVSDSQS
ncbi:MAG: TerB family tellurite resistance protein [Gammaproteobacteria bacterium]|nr:TerB family tellurite resistance protein [Gammaproteobacteria bacterium]